MTVVISEWCMFFIQIWSSQQYLAKYHTKSINRHEIENIYMDFLPYFQRVYEISESLVTLGLKWEFVSSHCKLFSNFTNAKANTKYMHVGILYLRLLLTLNWVAGTYLTPWVEWQDLWKGATYCTFDFATLSKHNIIRE